MTIDRRLLATIAGISLPAVVANITTPLLALTDVAVAGHLGAPVYIAAIAVGGTMFNMLFWLCGFLRMGSSGLTAQAFGAGDREAGQAIFNRAMLLAVIIGLLMIVCRHPLCSGLLALLDVEEETRLVASRYFMICVWGAPAVLGMFSLTGWCVGMQNSRLPMSVSLFIVVFNVAVSLTLVYVFRMKIEGIALGTLTAQWAGFLLALGLCVRRYGWHATPPGILLSGLRRFFSINADIFLRTVCLVAVTMWFTRVGAEQGTLMLAVNALLMQLFTLFSYIMDGLAFAAEALSGRYLGAGDRRMLSRAVKASLTLGGITALLFTVAYVLFGQSILSVLSSDEPVREMASEYSVWAVCVPMAGFSAFIWDGICIGLTRTRMMLLSMATATAVYFAVYFLLFPSLGNHGLWIAFLSYLLTRGIVLAVCPGRETLRQEPYSSR